ncbi:MAG: hypothetical protein WBM50_05550 [Acidimicrobiales bacterium]
MGAGQGVTWVYEQLAVADVMDRLVDETLAALRHAAALSIAE